jgi:alpha-D-xyloside xylohydrolase
MKADNTVIEIGEAAVPIFGDVDREYDHMQRMTEYRAIPGGVQCTVESFEGVSTRVLLQFVLPHVLRVQAQVDHAIPGSTPMLAGPLPKPISVRIGEGTDGLTLEGDETVLRVVQEPFQWLLSDHGGRLIAGQEIHDGTLRAQVSMPMGWSRAPGGSSDFHETLKLRPDEQLYGLGESFGALNRRDTRHISWSRDTHGTSTTPLTYLNVPFFISTYGYGIFINQTPRIVYEMGYPSQVSTSFRVEQPYLDYFVIYGPDMQSVLARYWMLTGQASLPPLWSFGVWMSRCMYRDADQVRAVVERMRELAIPLDVVNVDPRWLEARKHHERDACDFIWDEAAFGKPEAFARWLRERHVRLCLWENPYVWRDTALFKEWDKLRHFARTSDSRAAPSLENPKEAVCFDFTRPDAVRAWQDQHRALLRSGVAAFKTDYGEGVPSDALFADGTSGRETHNVYPLLYNKAVFDVINEERGEAVVFGRSGYAGSQRYPINWVGDTQCSWEGMAAALRAGLSLSLSGIPFWSHDIGGFWNPANAANGPAPDLYIRWAQWGLLSSHARFHGVRGREPWWYGDKAVEVVRAFARLRTRLLPYLWACANQAVATAAPVVRPMLLEFPDDPTTQHLDMQFMLGPWLLVAPVFNREGDARVYLPEGSWHDFWSGEVISGPRWLQDNVPIERIPLYIRDDSLLPLGPEMTFVGERQWSPLEVGVRLSDRATLDVRGEGVDLHVRARSHGRAVAIELQGRGDIELRFIAPTVSSVRIEGEGSNLQYAPKDNLLTASLSLSGSARLDAR